MNQYIVSQSSDRTCKVYFTKTNNYKEFSLFHSIKKFEYTPIDTSNTDESSCKRMQLFLSDSVNTFFRRLTWTPDGLLLITPCGVYPNSDQPKNTTFIWSRNDFSKYVTYFSISKQNFNLEVKGRLLIYLVDLNLALLSDVVQHSSIYVKMKREKVIPNHG